MRLRNLLIVGGSVALLVAALYLLAVLNTGAVTQVR
jgi:hypothetical protein